MIKEKLREVREKKGFSQEQLAELVGMTQPNYSRRENGFKKISSQEWDLFAKKLDVNKEQIYEEDNQNVVYKNIKGNSFNSGNISYFNVPDFVLEHIELLKVLNKELKEEIQSLKDQLKL
ncbi:helix-turn-helix domain-containing protein [Flavobacterium sp.]|jgi:transcriptional regulator with XRE-family HTH domain|uniref:helix-turn-helix domain-containing protein n=1 Tax=Flavobacterium sp. TaxID=239 RepID=UPI0037C164D3